MLLLLVTLAALADTLLAATGALQSLNAALTAPVYQLGQPWLDSLMIGFTYLGTAPAISLIVAAAALWALGRGYPRSALLMVATMVVAQGTAVLSKLVLQAPRPYQRPPPEPLTLLNDYGYPSGHAVMSIAILGFVAVVAWTLADRCWSRRLVPAATILAVAGIGFSRIYLGFHWLNDVVGGYLYGALILLLSTALYRCLGR
ncbi:MAG: phosphatase PAP2 family protein [Chloroflexota bacterium]